MAARGLFLGVFLVLVGYIASAVPSAEAEV
jgi:hypothetical protein